MFDGNTYADRRRRLCELVGDGVVLLLGNQESPLNYPGNPYPFRQDSTFLYFFGLEQPGLAAVIDVQEDLAILFGDDPELDDIVWTGPVPTVAERAAQAGVLGARPLAALAEVVTRARAAGRRIHFLPPYRAETALQLARLLEMPGSGDRAGGGDLVAAMGAAASRELLRAVIELRSVKSEAEVAEIEAAVDVTAAMELAAMRLAAPGGSEAVLAAAVADVAARAGCRMSFQPIVTIHGEILHSGGHVHELTGGRLVVCDCGAERPSGYAGDLTRTFPVDRSFTPRQREIYECVLAAQAAAAGALAPDVPHRDVHLLAARVMTAGLRDLGLMRGDPAEAVAAGAHALFFPHGLGHMMGLDVHDMEGLGEDLVGYGEGFTRSDQFGLKWLRLARPLRPGFVLTVEPGCYFIPELIRRWRRERHLEQFIDYSRLDDYLDFGGIRIEDDYLITPDGARRLGKAAPRTVREVEEVRKGG